MTVTRRVLIVDDDEATRDLLVDEFHANKCELALEVLSAGSIKEYWERLDEGGIHVLCVDVKLDAVAGGPQDDGIDGIAVFHRFKSPSTIIVVYSSFAGMNKVETTVRAMKAGAFAVIDKDKNGGFERRIVDLCVAELRRRTTLGGLDQEDWFETQLPKLIGQYAGQAVALAGNRVVAAGPSVAELRRTLDRSPPAEEVTILLVPDTVFAP